VLSRCPFRSYASLMPRVVAALLLSVLAACTGPAAVRVPANYQNPVLDSDVPGPSVIRAGVGF
jgi:hypothetical protein